MRCLDAMTDGGFPGLISRILIDDSVECKGSYGLDESFLCVFYSMKTFDQRFSIRNEQTRLK